MFSKNKIIITTTLVLVVIGVVFVVAKYQQQIFKKRFAYNNFTAAQQEKKIEVKLIIDTSTNKYEYNDVEITANSTVFDVLKKTSTDNNFSLVYKESDLGVFVEEIYGVKNNVSANKYWMYKVNGEIVNVGASSYEVNNGDEIGWYYGEATIF
ncbi:MAG: hypothetical protein BWY51_00360 [Parcubacteria group bacterium ADurb.Bin316]|nr:MAG: hypothetical protein BWY51_00360 [Parcubacteria group bacterium ADurb.Bin316]